MAGHPARLLETVRAVSLDARVMASEEAGLVRDVRREMDTTQAALAKSRRGDGRATLRAELKALRRELRARFVQRLSPHPLSCR